MDGYPLIDNFRRIVQSSLGVPLLVLTMLVTIILPIPPFMLDVLFSFNITLSILILASCIYISRPLNFSVFPTIILVSTLFRLTLNIASTRIVLLHGHNGPAAAGQVIKAFGEIVIGGNFTVGVVVFAILVIINFVVVTKGATRVSEVTARFTLDAMPGKQMAIDADLNAGIINQEQAQERRQEIIQEANFYGAMDGASKFVRGDAVAGLLILFINLIGGIAIGVADHGMAFGQAAQTFSLLTIGDGLVAQIPSLLLSSATALIITRVSKKQNLGEQTMEQLFSDAKPFMIAAVILGFLAIIPGMPHIAFIILTAISASISYWISQKNKTKQDQVEPTEQSEQQPEEKKELGWQDVRVLDIIEVEIGYRLIGLVGSDNEGILMSRIKGVRKKLSQDLGFLVPAVHIRDNLELPPSHYRISLLGVNCAEAEVHANMVMAINPGHVSQTIDGIATKDPTFGLDATWVAADKQEYAQSLGYTVVDASTVMATHLSHIIRQNCSKLLGHEEAQQLLDRLAESSPKLIESLTGNNGLSLSVIVKVLQKLLHAQISIIDMRTIAEKLMEMSASTQDPDALTEGVRSALKRMIIQNITGTEPLVPVIVFNPELEQIFKSSTRPRSNRRSSNARARAKLNRIYLRAIIRI